MPVDIRAVTIQSNKLVSSEVKDSLVLLESFYGKKKKQILWSIRSRKYPVKFEFQINNR